MNPDSTNSINCTVVELKHNLVKQSEKFSQGINCTVVELKHGYLHMMVVKTMY